MKKINLTISYAEEKVKALRWYLEQKSAKLEDELVKALDALFSKNVPANVRSYICKEDDSSSAVESPKPKKVKTGESLPQDGGSSN